MKTNYRTFEIVSDPTLEERLRFLEQGMRDLAPHELMCESKTPKFAGRKWPLREKITYPHPCDCWLSYPLGSVGLRPKVDKPTPES